jgi:hypothetical protein
VKSVKIHLSADETSHNRRIRGKILKIRSKSGGKIDFESCDKCLFSLSLPPTTTTTLTHSRSRRCNFFLYFGLKARRKREGHLADLGAAKRKRESSGQRRESIIRVKHFPADSNVIAKWDNTDTATENKTCASSERLFNLVNFLSLSREEERTTISSCELSHKVYLSRLSLCALFLLKTFWQARDRVQLCKLVLAVEEDDDLRANESSGKLLAAA